MAEKENNSGIKYNLRFFLVDQDELALPPAHARWPGEPDGAVAGQRHPDQQRQGLDPGVEVSRIVGSSQVAEGLTHEHDPGADPGAGHGGR